MKKILANTFLLSILTITGIASLTAVSSAQTDTSSTGRDLVKEYVPLTGTTSIPGLQQAISASDSFQSYITLAYSILISVTIVLAVVLTVFHGFQYSISDLFRVKMNAKEALTNIVIGLGLILGAYLILFTINPSIINLSFIADLNQRDGDNPTNVPAMANLRDCNEITGTSLNSLTEGVWLAHNYDCRYTADNGIKMSIQKAVGVEFVEEYTDNSVLCDAKIEQLAQSQAPNSPTRIEDLNAASCIYVKSNRWSVHFTGHYPNRNPVKDHFALRTTKADCEALYDNAKTKNLEPLKLMTLTALAIYIDADNREEELAKVAINAPDTCQPVPGQADKMPKNVVTF